MYHARPIARKYPIVIPTIHYYHIQNCTREFGDSERSVILGIKRYPSYPWICSTLEKMKWYIIIFCVRFIHIDVFQPLVAIRYNDSFIDIDQNIKKRWQQVIEDLESINLTVVASVSSMQKILRNVLISFSGSSIRNNTNPINYSVIPGKVIFHIFEMNSLYYHLEKKLKKVSYIFFLACEEQNKQVRWHQVNMDYIKTMAISTETLEGSVGHISNELVTIFDSSFYYKYQRKVQPLQPPRNTITVRVYRYLAICCAYSAIFDHFTQFTSSELIHLYNSLSHLRLALSTSYLVKKPIKYNMLKRELNANVTYQYRLEQENFKHSYIDNVKTVENVSQTDIVNWNVSLVTALNSCRITKLKNELPLKNIRIPILKDNFQAELTNDLYIFAENFPQNQETDIQHQKNSNTECSGITENVHIADNETSNKTLNQNKTDSDLDKSKMPLKEVAREPPIPENPSELHSEIYKKMFRNVLGSSKQKKRNDTDSIPLFPTYKRIKINENSAPPTTSKISNANVHIQYESFPETNNECKQTLSIGGIKDSSSIMQNLNESVAGISKVQSTSTEITENRNNNPENQSRCKCNESSTSKTYCPLHYSNSEYVLPPKLDSQECLNILPFLYDQLPTNCSHHWIFNIWLASINSLLTFRNVLISRNINVICSGCFSNRYIDEYMLLFQYLRENIKAKPVPTCTTKTLYNQHIFNILQNYLIDIFTETNNVR